MNYYVLNSNEEIELFDTDKSRLQTTLKFKPELSDKTIQETEREIIELDGKFVFADEHQEKISQQKEEQETEQELLSLEDTLKELKNLYLQAQILGDNDTMADVTAQIKELLGITEEQAEIEESNGNNIEE